MATPLVEVQGLQKHFASRGLFGWGGTRVVRAVDGVSFHVEEGETLALVGESGCGKSTTGRLVLRLLEPTAGSVRFRGRDLGALGAGELKGLRRRMQVIFQDPFASLNPRKSIRHILSQPFAVHEGGGAGDHGARVRELLEVVGLSPAAQYIDRHPHEFSGGQRQRIGIARALALRPELIVADEPVSALDVSVRAQILTLMKRLQREFHLTYLFITHDLGVVRSISQRVAVMYLGKLVELGPVEAIFAKPLHPYTEALLSATPIPDPRLSRARRRIILGGEVPSPVNPPPGCRFHTRCPLAEDICRRVEPPLLQVGRGHWAACHLRQPAGAPGGPP